MSHNLPPSGDVQRKTTEMGKISDFYRPDMTKPEIKSKFPLADRFMNIINCCKPPKDPVGTMLD
jgi:hypothetical protein